MVPAWFDDDNNDDDDDRDDDDRDDDDDDVDGRDDDNNDDDDDNSDSNVGCLCCLVKGRQWRRLLFLSWRAFEKQRGELETRA